MPASSSPPSSGVFGLANGMPTGISGWVKAIATLGTTGAVIVAMGYLLYATVEGNRADAAAATLTVLEAIHDHDDEGRVHSNRMEELYETQLRLQRQICVNTAPGTAERLACF